jgi:hypothetical protein
MSFKEISCYVYAWCIRCEYLVDSYYIKFNNPNDVLRVAVALSSGDISLAEPTMFRNFKRKERRL